MTLLREIKFAAMRCFLQTVGRTSDGVRIAFDEGFTSGAMLDYVYRNQPSGRLGIGPLIDQVYLSHPGWEVIRVRKFNLERLLHEAVLTQADLGRAPMVLDVASGPAQYLLNVLAGDVPPTTRAVCQDRDERVLELGRKTAQRCGVAGWVRFVVGDALSRDSLSAVQPRPNVVVASGFYDWITDDAMVQQSMRLIAECIEPGGCFVFTNQSGHVDLQMVQAVFRDFHGEPLRMVTRPAAVVNQWAQDAGFDVQRVASDTAGHYSVTLARRAN